MGNEARQNYGNPSSHLKKKTRAEARGTSFGESLRKTNGFEPLLRSPESFSILQNCLSVCRTAGFLAASKVEARGIYVARVSAAACPVARDKCRIS